MIQFTVRVLAYLLAVAAVMAVMIGLPWYADIMAGGLK